MNNAAASLRDGPRMARTFQGQLETTVARNDDHGTVMTQLTA